MTSRLNPAHAAGLRRDRSFSLALFPITAVSALLCAGLLGLELVLIRSDSLFLLGIGLLVSGVHALYGFGVLLMCAVAGRDALRLTLGRRPKYFTPELMARIDERKGRPSVLATILMMATPWFPVTLYFVGEAMERIAICVERAKQQELPGPEFEEEDGLHEAIMVLTQSAQPRFLARAV